MSQLADNPGVREPYAAQHNAAEAEYIRTVVRATIDQILIERGLGIPSTGAVENYQAIVPTPSSDSLRTDIQMGTLDVLDVESLSPEEVKQLTEALAEANVATTRLLQTLDRMILRSENMNRELRRFNLSRPAREAVRGSGPLDG